MYLQDPNGSVHPDLTGDDLLYSIKEKFYWPFDAVRSQLEKEFGNDRSMYIYVDPCWDDTTYALLTFQNEHVLFSYGSKPWTFWWDSEAEMRNDLKDWYEKARERYRKFAGLPAKKARK